MVMVLAPTATPPEKQPQQTSQPAAASAGQPAATTADER